MYIEAAFGIPKYPWAAKTDILTLQKRIKKIVVIPEIAKQLSDKAEWMQNSLEDIGELLAYQMPLKVFWAAKYHSIIIGVAFDCPKDYWAVDDLRS